MMGSMEAWGTGCLQCRVGVRRAVLRLMSKSRGFAMGLVSQLRFAGNGKGDLRGASTLMDLIVFGLQNHVFLHLDIYHYI